MTAPSDETDDKTEPQAEPLASEIHAATDEQGVPAPAAPSEENQQGGAGKKKRRKAPVLPPPLWGRWDLWFGILVVVFFGIILRILSHKPTSHDPAKPRLWIKEHLRHYNGEKNSPLYLAIMGEVFDVSKAKKYYGKGNGYHHFVGRDGTKAFITGHWDTDLTDDVHNMSREAYAGMVHWRKFYRETYEPKGLLVGKFYNPQGKPRGLLKHVERMASQAASEEEKNKELEKQFPRCNVRWSQADGGAVWCDDGYPRKIFTTEAGKPSTRCACFKDFGWSDVRQLYPDCKPKDSTCVVSPPENQQQQQQQVEGSAPKQEL